MKTITVITATLNSAAVLPSALRGIVRQTYPAIEHIIVDGGSTDSTLALAEAARPIYESAGKTLRIITGPDRGIYDAMNKGIRAATGEIIGILNSDDYITDTGAMARIAAAFDAHPDTDAVYGDLTYVRRHDTSLTVRTYCSAPFSRRMMLMGFMPPHPTLYCRREVYSRFGLYDISYAIAGDFDFTLRAIYHGRISTRRLKGWSVTMRDGGATDRSLLSHLRGLWEKQRAYMRRRVPTCILLDAVQLAYKLAQVRLPRWRRRAATALLAAMAMTATLSASSTATAPASAAPPAEAPADSAIVRSLAQVDVTAIKSGTRLSDEPVAATTIGARQIERLGILTMKGASPLVPNFYVPDYGSRITSSVYVRGLGARIDQPVVGLTVDNVTYLNKDNYDFDLPDISRIEVIRGPQSALYGRNTMGGTVSIHTLSPMEWQGLRVMASLGWPFSAKAAATLYTRPTERLAMSIGAALTHTDGHWRNAYNHSRIGSENAASARWKTLWRPSGTLSLENVAALQLNNQNGYPYRYCDTGQISYNDTCFYRRTGLSDGLTISWRPGSTVSLTSVSSVQYINDNMTLDNDFLPQDYFTLTQRRHEWALTQDIIVKGTAAAGRYEWLAGIFGFYRSSEMDAPVSFGDHGIAELIEKNRNKYNPQYPIRWDTRSFTLDSRFGQRGRGAAVYHRSTLNAGPLSIAAALRLDYERPTLDYRNGCHTSYTTYNLYDPAAPAVYSRNRVDIDEQGRLSMSFTQLLPQITLSWSLPRAGNLYASVAKGYKAGGFNTQMFSDVLQQKLMSYMGISSQYDIADIISYRPEWSWNYEAGAHLSFPAASLSADLAIFYIDCHDQQLTVFPNGNTTGRMMTNAGRTRSAGGELSLRWAITPRWHAEAAYGLTDARFRTYDSGIADYSGKRVPYAPSNTLWASARHYLPLHTATAGLRGISLELNMRGVGSIYWDEANTMRQPFYIIPGASATLHADRFDLEARCSNFTDTRHDVFSFVSIGHRFVQSGPGCSAEITFRLNLDNIY